MTEYVVNTRSNTVHTPDCKVVTRAAHSKWLAPWRGVGRADHDKACGYCLPHGLPAPETGAIRAPFGEPFNVARILPGTADQWCTITFRLRPDGDIKWPGTLAFARTIAETFGVGGNLSDVMLFPEETDDRPD